MNYQDNHKTSKSEFETIDILKKTLLNSFQKLQGIERCGILFSGGVDSSLAALLAERYCEEVTLFSSCTEDSRDFRFVSRAADILNLELIITKMSSESVWRILPEVVYAIERNHRMDVEIALPFFLSSREAKKKGIYDIVSGQGPDELFAGYARHEEIFKEEGEESLQEKLREEISITHTVNIERDNKAITFNDVVAHFPYLDEQFVMLALSIPGHWKISPNKSPNRKVIFRKLAVELGLPSELSMKPKDATQYSSGSSKVLIDSIRDYVIYPESLSRKKASMLVQDVLNLISFKIGLLSEHQTNPELKIDLKPTEEFIMRLKSSNHQQLMEE